MSNRVVAASTRVVFGTWVAVALALVVGGQSGGQYRLRGRPLAAKDPGVGGGIDRSRVVVIGMAGSSRRATPVGHHQKWR